MKFADKLGLIIEERGVSQSELARRTGIPQSSISKMSAGDRRPYLDQGFALARVLGVSLDYLADEEREEPPGLDLSERERQVRDVIRLIGVEEAYRRLVGVPSNRPPLVVESRLVGPAADKKEVG